MASAATLLAATSMARRRWLPWLLLGLWACGPVWAQPAVQGLGYWKPFVISADDDPAVARAQRVFDTLLRAWDGTRVEPSLYVVKSSRGPWAASLADGNILLSRAAIDTTLALDSGRADHLLAFVLAHELVHQRADDLWHHKFFRLVGSQNPQQQQALLRGLDMSDQALPDLERREAQADHDGLVLMASVGYDPFVVVDGGDFFTRWVESVWAAPCGRQDPAWQGAGACAQARTRAARSRAQLEAVATQATLFQLGVQAFAAGHWQAARRDFSAYGREFPSRAVHVNIGLTYLAEALDIRDRLSDAGVLPGPRFFFPLLLELHPEATPLQPRGRVRGNAEERKRLRQYAERAAQSFERAMRLEPQHRGSYLLLGLAYLLADNAPMVRGVLEGKYIPRFGSDASTRLLLAMTQAQGGDLAGAARSFQQLLTSLEASPPSGGPWPADLLIYTAFHNATVLVQVRGDNSRRDELWQRAARLAQRNGQALLFQLAVEQLRPGTLASRPPAWVPSIQGARLGDRVQASVSSSPFWLEGEALSIYRFANGARWVVDADGRLVNAWQSGGQARLGDGLALGDDADRPLKVLGPPSRRIELVSGVYLAYDALGLAIRLENNRISGWFLYHPDG